MRTTPLKHSEMIDLQRRMLQSAGLIRDARVYAALNAPTDARQWIYASESQYSKRGALALEISDVFVDLAETSSDLQPGLSPPRTEKEMLEEIRYAFGWNWLAWLLIRHFVTFIVHWLWKNYHNQTDNGEDADRTIICPSPGSHS